MESFRRWSLAIGAVAAFLGLAPDTGAAGELARRLGIGWGTGYHADCEGDCDAAPCAVGAGCVNCADVWAGYCDGSDGYAGGCHWPSLCWPSCRRARRCGCDHCASAPACTGGCRRCSGCCGDSKALSWASGAGPRPRILAFLDRPLWGCCLPPRDCPYYSRGGSCADCGHGSYASQGEVVDSADEPAWDGGETPAPDAEGIDGDDVY